ncbi:MAG TPA: hypothetical protein VIS51_01130 [Solirubrobacterales bacterium]
MAADQRYCLACGTRCGEPRLPVMDAVTLMDAMKQPRQASPPPPQRPKRRMSPNMALFATIGVLLLAMGVGVLIGRSGNQSVATAPAAPQVIKVGGGEEGATASTGGAGSAPGGAGTKKQKPEAKKKVEAKAQEEAENVLKTAPDVKLADPKVQVGESCEKEAAGCGDDGKFDGSFFE